MNVCAADSACILKWSGRSVVPARGSRLTLRNTLKAKTGSCQQGKASCSDNQLQAASTAAPQLFGPPLEARQQRRAGGCNETKKHTSWCMCFLGICIVKLRQLAASSSFATFTQPQVIYALIVSVSPATSAPPRRPMPLVSHSSHCSCALGRCNSAATLVSIHQLQSTWLTHALGPLMYF